jgi:ABC-type Fe3+ transport system permease subunit
VTEPNLPATGPSNLPAKREPVKPAARSRWRHRRWVALAVALVLALCIAVPVGYVVWPLVTGTLNADNGQGSPNAARRSVSALGGSVHR